jgi:hypothetical protein
MRHWAVAGKGRARFQARPCFGFTLRLRHHDFHPGAGGAGAGVVHRHDAHPQRLPARQTCQRRVAFVARQLMHEIRVHTGAARQAVPSPLDLPGNPANLAACSDAA